MKQDLWLRSRRLIAKAGGGILVLIVALAASFAISRSSSPPVTQAASRATIDQHVAAGALNYITYGCENCHGLYGRGGVKVPNISGSATIPALNTPLVLKSLSVSALRAFIEHGVVYATKTTQVYMPVWGTVLSDRQLADLISYIRAGLPRIPGIDPQPVRTDLGLQVEGQQLYVRYGCVVCHAFNGFGGVPNPASPDKLVPPLRGPDFDKQFTKDSDIAYVIKHGSIIGQPPIVSMPVWSGLLSDQQINAIVTYIRSFR